MTVQYTITGSAWVPVSAAGQSIRAWLDEDSDGAVGQVDVRVVSSNTGVPSDFAATIGKRVSKPSGNDDVFEDNPSSTEHIFYAKCRNVGDEATMSVEASFYDQPSSSQLKIPGDEFFTQSNGAPTTLSQEAIKDTYDVVVTDPSTFSVGDLAYIFESNGANAAYSGEVLAVVGSTITFDELLNYSFSAGSIIQSLTHEMNVDGSVTPQVFNVGVSPAAFFSKVNITRFMVEMLTTNQCDLSTFGDISGGVTKGLLFRGVPDPSTGLAAANNFNIKTNSDLKLLSYDLDIESASNPQQGQNGLHARYTYGSEDKHDVIPQLQNNDQIQVVIQDDLTSLLRMRVMAQGNFEL